MLRRWAGALLVLVGVVVLGGAVERVEMPARGFVFEEVEVGGREYAYAVYVPREYDAGEAWPLVVFLHGRGECGTDGQRQLAVGLGPRVLWNPERYPAVVLFPQKPTQDSQWEDHIGAVRAMMGEALGRYAIDEDRVYLTGLSQGGHGTWTINAAMPGVFAAIAPVCGYATLASDWEDRGAWRPDRASAMYERIVEAGSRVPVWAFHGAADDVVPAAHTEAVVGDLVARGADARMTIYPGVGHGCWDAAYGDEAFSAWLFAQRRE